MQGWNRSFSTSSVNVSKLLTFVFSLLKFMLEDFGLTGGFPSWKVSTDDGVMVGLSSIYFWDDVFLVWPHSREDLNLFFNYMSNIDCTKKIQFTMEVAKDILECLDLRLKFDKESKCISGDIFSWATNSFYIRTS